MASWVFWKVFGGISIYDQGGLAGYLLVMNWFLGIGVMTVYWSMEQDRTAVTVRGWNELFRLVLLSVVGKADFVSEVFLVNVSPCE